LFLLKVICSESFSPCLDNLFGSPSFELLVPERVFEIRRQSFSRLIPEKNKYLLKQQHKKQSLKGFYIYISQI
jgi:hypothetical protein